MVHALSAGVPWLLLLIAAAMRLPPGRRPVPDPLGRPLSPVRASVLRGGGRAAAQTGLVELCLTGSVEAGWRRTVEPGGPRLPRHCSEAARATFHALHRPLHPRRLEDMDRVRRAVHGVSAELERAGLVSRRRVRGVRGLLLPVFAAAPLGAVAGGQTTPCLVLGLLADVGAVALWFGPRRTLRGGRLPARLRRDHAGARRADERRPETLLLSVALFGAPALRAQLPRFTEESGLLTRPPREPMDRGGGAGAGVASCGG